MKKSAKKIIGLVSCLALMTSVCLSSFAYVRSMEVRYTQWEYYTGGNYKTGHIKEIDHITYRTIMYPEGQTVREIAPRMQRLDNGFTLVQIWGRTHNYFVG